MFFYFVIKIGEILFSKKIVYAETTLKSKNTNTTNVILQNIYSNAKPITTNSAFLK
jgi:hypothetical protein